ncbi:sensor histidine kinase [Yinghuangia soli]|uniref:histidine kinase n=1 Tax=Yinghuangia soli TaxID=2908204 RepID=A0AA41Q755_9ACTN|nr:HAMP domain-containing sensor histidine kinase [Yinghuangia soli]MCF2532477.1 HAMP domain-containing histidine kinase [Yinghuangia soli]
MKRPLRAARRSLLPGRLPPRRMTLCTRLTLIHGGLFLVAGAVLLATTYALFERQLAQRGRLLVTKGPPSGGSSEPAAYTFGFTGDGSLLAGRDAERWMHDQQAMLHDAAATSLLSLGAVALALVGVLAAVAGRLATGRALVPLDRVTATARRISAAPTADRLPYRPVPVDTGAPSDEVTDLTVAFNAMVERLDRSLEGQRRFVANASHELRTPLTLARSVVELAVRRHPSSAELRRLAEQLLEINVRHERLLAGLLTLADAENELATRRPVDLAEVIARVVAQTSHEAGAAGITVHHRADSAPVRGDAALLERLIHNLVENGIRHNTGPGGRLEVTGRCDGDTAEVEVRNTGPEVPQDQAEAIFEPFRRLPPARSPAPRGSGLGLSIVRAIARAHGGTATASPLPGGGLAVAVRLPSG